MHTQKTKIEDKMMAPFYRCCNTCKHQANNFYRCNIPKHCFNGFSAYEPKNELQSNGQPGAYPGK